MIASFPDRETEALFPGEQLKGIDAKMQRVAMGNLVMIDAAARIDDLRVPPGSRLETLMGKRAGQYSIRVNNQCRIELTWRDGQAQGGHWWTTNDGDSDDGQGTESPKAQAHPSGRGAVGRVHGAAGDHQVPAGEGHGDAR